MPVVDVKIWSALKARVIAATAGLHVSWPGEEFLPNNKRFISVARMINEPVRVLIKSGQKHDRTGMLILADVSPLGSREELYIQRAGELAAFFEEGTCLTFDGVRVEIYNTPHVQEGYRDGGHWRTPVVIQWRSFA